MDIGAKFRKKKLTDIGLSLAFQRLLGYLALSGFLDMIDNLYQSTSGTKMRHDAIQDKRAIALFF